MAILSFLSFLSIYGQYDASSLGARGSAMGGTSATLIDEYSLFNNVGVLGRLESHSFFASYRNNYGIPEFQTIAGGVIYHHSLANVGLGYYKFGDFLYSNQKLGLAIGNQLQVVSIGLGVELIQYHIESLGVSHSLSISFGGMVDITPHLFFALQIFNLSQSKINLETDESIPTIMKMGFSYIPSNELIIAIEVEKDLEFKEIFKCGLEYKLIKDLFLRTGLRTNPFEGAVGFGFHPNNLMIDSSFFNNTTLGSSLEFSIAYRIGA